MRITTRITVAIAALLIAATGCKREQQEAPPPKPTISLKDAVSSHNVAQVKSHLHWGCDVNEQVRDYGQTHLLWIAGSTKPNSAEITKLLIDAGAKVNTRSDLGFTPLHEAASSGQLRNVELLIAAGADVNAKADNGKTPLQSAGKNKDVADLLRQHGAK